MVYKEHGLTLQIALNTALNAAGIEMISYVAPYAITTDTICIIDTTKHDEKIRADERAKAIDECFKAMRKKVDEVFQRQTEERHEKVLSAYGQSFDCFSMATIEFEILKEVEKKMKGDKK